jgi:integral membrane protein (TIGR01906 family)
MNKFILSLSAWFASLLLVFALLGLAFRLLLTPLFLQVEYRLPYFPPDQYGFTQEDRLHWAPYALKYLVNQADISYLGELSFADGSPLFNERELSHMQDVKGVTQSALGFWYGSLALLVGLAVWARFGGWWTVFLQGLRRGGWLLVGLVVAVGTFGALAFWQFFTLFHNLFFEGDSWLFYYSDTLIRLFPIRFWQDVSLAAAMIVVGGGISIGLGVKLRD